MESLSPRFLRWSLTCCSLALSLPTLSQAAFSLDSAPGRLPKTVAPVSYDIDITPDAEKLAIRGTESVVLQVRSATDTLVLNSVDEQLSDVRLDGQPAARVESSNEKEWTTITLTKPAPVGQHTLTFSYTGKIQTRPRGLFLQHYTTAGAPQGVLLSTQMEAADARRMFPCWDEPAFRAEFQLTVTVPAKWATISNMPVAKRVPHGPLMTTTFQRTPRMPSYLVEFSAGDLAEVAAASDGVDFGVWAVRGQERYGSRALIDAQRILQDYDQYFGYRYPLPKLDSIAIPGGFNGAMENWGAITYNDRALLVPPSSTVEAQQTVFSIEAHEMAHLWNGDLVTMAWWDDLWLNESFASWMAAKETALRHPEWHWWESEDASKESAMHADARASSHAIQQHVTNELEADNAFDPAITYNKGQAILRMLESYIGPDTFRSGVRTYIKARAFSNATTSDLWNGLNQASGRDVGKVASDWTVQPGFPLITATASCDSSGKRTLKMDQSRFLLQGSDKGHSHWSVPLQMRIGATGTPQAILLTQNGQTVAAGPCNEPLSLDANAIGFYRVRYDSTLLSVNTKSFARLPAGDRIALLDDQWALVGSGKQPLGSYLALAQEMGANLSVRAWEQLRSALSTIEYDERGNPDHAAFLVYARSLVKPAMDQVGWDAKPGETPDVPALRRAVLENLGQWGDSAVLAEARRRFDALIENHSTLGPDDVTTVVEIAARHADAQTFEKIHRLAKGAKDDTERQRYYSALMLVNDDTLADQAAQIALSSEVPPQLDSQRLVFVVSLARQHQQLAWKIFRDHTQQILSPHSPFEQLYIAQLTPEVFWDSVPLQQLDSWVRAHVPPEMSDTVDRGMEGARYKLAEKQVLISAADAWKKAPNAALLHPSTATLQASRVRRPAISASGTFDRSPRESLQAGMSPAGGAGEVAARGHLRTRAPE